MTKRIILIVLDSVGIGELPDAALYGDKGSNTLVNTATAVGGLKVPNLAMLGLGNIAAIPGVKTVQTEHSCYGKMQEVSKGKDTTTGHWEIAGVILDNPFPTYPDGFPSQLINQFEERIGTRILGNVVASGTEIIKVLGEEHQRTGYPIVYTSADSVFQIAAHEEVISLERLYEICRIAREMLTGEHNVGRVIARPFVGNPGNYTRTGNRRDFSLLPTEETVLDLLKKNSWPVLGVGKIEDIFAGQGITKSMHTQNNGDSTAYTIKAMDEFSEGLIFTNLIDFDMLYGHRNDFQGYAAAIEEFDRHIPTIIAKMREDDLLIITADHGNDPTTPSTDHSREYVPLLVYGRKVFGRDLGIRSTMADLGATIAAYFQLPQPRHGNSFLKELY